MDIKQNSSRASKRVLLVECARGAAAIYVCLGHVALIGHLAESFKWGKPLFYLLGFGEEAVYLFFFLSGFSIHYSSHNRPMETGGGILYYYYLRFRRIYPIFLVAVALSIVLGFISEASYSLTTGNLSFVLLFLTDIHGGNWHSGLSNDPALWSLSYEIPYYLVYPIFWKCCKRFGVGRAFGASFLASSIFIMADCVKANHVSNVFSLYWLWTCGALMAEWKLTNRRFTLSPVAYYFVLFSCYVLSESAQVIGKPVAVILCNMKALTIGVIIFSTFINFQLMSFSKRALAVGGIGILLIVTILTTHNVPISGRHIILDARFIGAASFISLLLVTGKNVAWLCRIIAKPFLKAGTISYALYVIHMPILYFIADELRHAGASILWMPFALFFIFPFSWWLETQFQTRVAGWLDSTRAKLLRRFRLIPATGISLKS